MTATRSYNPLHQPTDKQRIAIDTLITGGTHAEAAEAAGVHRVTVSNWATKVPGFKAELNRRRAELLSGTSDRIRELDSQALAIVAASAPVPVDEIVFKFDKRTPILYSPEPPFPVIEIAPLTLVMSVSAPPMNTP